MDRKVIVIHGGHASGKTTFCQNIEKSLDPSKVCVVYSDLDSRFKALLEDKKDNLIDLLSDEPRPIIFEGMRGPVGMYETFLEHCTNLTIICALMSPERMKANLQHRKASLGKPWDKKQDDYWTESKLRYEAHTRFINTIAKLRVDYSDKMSQIAVRFVSLANKPGDFSAWEPEYPRVLREILRG